MYVQCSKEAIQSHTRKTLGTVTSLAHRYILERVKVPNLEPYKEKQSSVYFQHGTFFETSLVQNQQCLYNNI